MSTRGIINANDKVRRNLFMKQERRQISNNPSRRRGNYRSSKQTFKQRAAAFFGAGIILGGVGVGIGKTVISNMAEKANYNKDLQTAIELANEQESRIRGIEEQLSYEPEDERNEQMENVEKLEQAIQTYTSLRNKPNMMLEEQEAYTEAVKTIIDSKDFVIDLYEDVMANQIAQAYGIKNPEAIEIHDNINREGDHRTVINLPDGRTIHPKDFFFLSSKDTLNGTAKQLIINARELLDEDRNHTTTNMENLKPVADKIIDTYQEAADLKENYKFYVNEKGQFVAEKIEKEEQQNKTIQTRDDDEER